MLGYKFLRQHGVEQYILVFYCPELCLAIELDEGSHESEQAKRHDEGRNKVMEHHGIHVLRFRGEDVFCDIDVVLKRIAGEILKLRRS